MAPELQRLRLGVLISGAGSTLDNLIQRIAARALQNVEIAVVISSRAAVRGVEIARAASLRTVIIRPPDFPDAGAFSAAIDAALREADVDLVVMAGFVHYWHVPPHFVGRTLNIHPSLLPAFGGQGMYGLRVHQAVLDAGERISGCTVHLVNDEYDRGPIIAQSRLTVAPSDTPESLQQRVAELERELYPAVIHEIAARGIAWLRSQADAQSAREVPER